MSSDKALLAAGIVLLAVSALSGFAQERYRHEPEAFALWRVVHNGGTAGAVQLLALGAVWTRFARGLDPGLFSPLLSSGLIVSTVCFFLGPLARVLHLRRTGRAFIAVGASLALPSYAALPLLLL